MNRYRTSVGIAVALLSVSLMSTEMVLTRIFSVVLWYHFAFFAISVALFGTGAAGIVVHLSQTRIPSNKTSVTLSWCSAALCVVTLASNVILVKVVPAWFGHEALPRFVLTAKLLTIFAVSALPFFVGGLGVSLAMARYARDVHRLYFWDLGGASMACLLVIPLLGAFGGTRALFVVSAIAAASSVLFAAAAPAADGPAPQRAGMAAFAVAVALSVCAVFFGWFEISAAKGIDLQKREPEYNRWNSFSMVTVLPGSTFRGWGISPAYNGPIAPQKTLVIDMNAMTTLTHFDGNFQSVQHALFDLSALVYTIRPGTSDVCIIGAGGGKDVLAALAAGTRHVTAVEINPLIVDGVVRGRYRDFTGNLYSRRDVEVHVEDGRSYVRGAKRRFDVILLSMVDTSAATAAGAYALTENSLYTTDAFVDFLSHLNGNGILSVSTASLEGLALGARLAGIARAALEKLGRDGSKSIVVAQTAWLNLPGTTLHDVLIKPAGFTPEEVQRLGGAINTLGFVPTYLPEVPVAARSPEQFGIQTMIAAPDSDLRRYLASLPLDISPVDDDRPFFFYQNRLRDFGRAVISESPSHAFGNGIVMLAKVLVIAFVVTLLFLIAPLVTRRKDLRGGEGSLGADLAYVGCLGLGFMLVEIATLQRFMLYLGHPTYTLVVVLFVLLLFGALGARLSGRISRTAKGFAGLFLAIAAYITVLRYGAPAIFHATIAIPALARAVIAVILLAPLGFLLGMPFPAGLRTIAHRAPMRLPWLWSINSATSVLGSGLATLVSLHGGIGLTFFVGAGSYLLAMLLWLKMTVF